MVALRREVAARSCSTEPIDRPIVELALVGDTAEEIARQCRCSVRTVGRIRQRARQRLLRQLDP